jgi:hypothetical protein
MPASEVWVRINAAERSVAAKDDESVRSVIAALREVAKSLEQLEKANRVRKALE